MHRDACKFMLSIRAILSNRLKMIKPEIHQVGFDGLIFDMFLIT